MKKRDPLCTVDINVNWCRYHQQYECSSKKLKIKLLYDPAILSIYPKKMKPLMRKDICNSTFRAALFSKAKI